MTTTIEPAPGTAPGAQLDMTGHEMGGVGSVPLAGVSEADAHVDAEGGRRGETLATGGEAYRAGGSTSFEPGEADHGETERAEGEHPVSDDAAPLSHALHVPTLADDPAPLSHLLHIPVLSKD